MPDQSKETDPVASHFDEQLNNAKFVVAEIKNLLESVQAAGNETVQARDKATGAYQSLQQSLDSATETVNEIADARKRLEQMRETDVKPHVDAIAAAHSEATSNPLK